MTKLVYSIIREGLVFLAFICISVAAFYASLVYPPFPEPVTYIEAGMTSLDMPLPGYKDGELVPDFITGAVYRKSELQAVFNVRARLTGFAIRLALIGYPIYLFIIFLVKALERIRVKRKGARLRTG